MAISIGSKPLADFSEPIEMMEDCHRRIEHFLRVLQEAERLFGDKELNEDARLALKASLNYFADSAPRHTADEEQSLFPRMRCSDDSSARAVMTDLDGLERDHRSCEALHTLVDREVRSWLEAGRIVGVQRQRLREALNALEKIYTAHIKFEEEQVFPVAARILRSEHLREIGEEMKERRSIVSLEQLNEETFKD